MLKKKFALSPQTLGVHIQKLLNFAKMTLYLSGKLNCVLLTIRLFFTSSSSQVQQVWQMNYSAAHSHGAYAEKECFQSNLALPLHNRRES